MIPHKMGHKDKSVHNSDRLGGLSGRSIRAIDQGGRWWGQSTGWALVSYFPASSAQVMWQRVTFLGCWWFGRYRDRIAYTQRFPWSRNPSLKSSMGKICQDPHIQLFIDIRWGAQSLSLVLLTWDLGQSPELYHNTEEPWGSGCFIIPMGL